MKVFVTGAAGFIGSNLVDSLLTRGYSVVGYDNLSTGKREFLENALKNNSFKFYLGDINDKISLSKAMMGCDFVFHLAANADVRYGFNHPHKDFHVNTFGTFNVLEAMREVGIRKIAFSSTGSVYGEAKVFPTPEDAPFPIQTSLYGASKLAGESLISSYVEGFDFQAWIFRFVSILGERYSHGHVFDFYQMLLHHPDFLHVLGNGLQKKSYLYVGDCINAMFIAIEQSKEKLNIFNLGTDEFCTVKDSISWITDFLGLSPNLTYSNTDRGWVGDNPFIFLDCNRIRSLNWHPKLSISEGVIKTVEYLRNNHWLIN